MEIMMFTLLVKLQDIDIHGTGTEGIPRVCEYKTKRDQMSCSFNIEPESPALISL